MTDKRTQELASQGNMLKVTQNWVTGHGSMTCAQRSYQTPRPATGQYRLEFQSVRYAGTKPPL